jgi:hypothetical protein
MVVLGFSSEYMAAGVRPGMSGSNACSSIAMVQARAALASTRCPSLNR